MKNWLVFSLIAILMMLSNKASARIGETLDQCKARYGEPVTVDGDTYTFMKNGLLVIVEFYENKVDLIGFRKAEENALSIAADMSDNEIQTILSANGNGNNWRKREVISINKEWEAEDVTMFAQYITMQNILMIFTKEYLARFDAAKKAKENNNLKGF